MDYRQLFSALVSAKERGEGPVTTLCACHVEDYGIQYASVIRPGDAIAIVHPDNCEKLTDGVHAICLCNDGDNKDTDQIN